MKRMISAVMAIALMLALVGCGNSAQTTPTTAAPATQAPATDAPATEAPETEAAAELSGTVSTDGSTSMEAVIGALGEAFMEANPDVNFTYNPTGSGSGIQASDSFSSAPHGLARLFSRRQPATASRLPEPSVN